MVFGGATVQPSSTVQDLGVILDIEMSFGPYINQLVSLCFYQLRCIKACVKALPMDVAKTEVNSIVVSRRLLTVYCLERLNINSTSCKQWL